MTSEKRNFPDGLEKVPSESSPNQEQPEQSRELISDSFQEELFSGQWALDEEGEEAPCDWGGPGPEYVCPG